MLNCSAMVARRTYAAGFIGAYIPKELERRFRQEAYKRNRTITEQLIYTLDRFLTAQENADITIAAKEAETNGKS